MILLRAFVLNFEHLDILRDTIRHPSKKLLSFEFAQRFNIQFLASRYVTGHNQSKKLLSFEFAQSFGIQFRAFKYFTVLYQTSESRLLSFEFAQSFDNQFRAS